MDDAEKIRNFDKLTFEEICELIGQQVEDYLDDAIPFNYALTIRKENSFSLVKDIVELLHRRKLCLRTQRLENHLNTLLANLFKSGRVKMTSYVYYSASPNEYKYVKRYNPFNISFRPLMAVIDALIKVNLVEYHRGIYKREKKKGKRSRIKPTSKLYDLFLHHNINAQNLFKLYQDPIRLKDKKKRLADYNETRARLRMRNTVIKYNKLLNKSSIELPLTNAITSMIDEKVIDFSNQSYYRSFNDGSFKLGGRFYGPWYQSVNEEVRSHILINKKKVVELDYSSLHMHLLYSWKGIDYHQLYGADYDAYIIEGFENDRKIVKTAFLIALNMKTKRNFPQAVTSVIKDKEYFRKGIDYKDILNAFEINHPKIKDYMFSGIGKKLQYLDSCIAEYIIKKMTRLAIPVLCIHDSFITEYSNKNVLKDIMYESFKYHKLKSIPMISVK